MGKKRSWDHEASLKVPMYTYLASSFLGATLLLFLTVGLFAISRGRVFLTLKNEIVPLEMSVTIKPTPGPGELFGFVREVAVSGDETAAVPQGATSVGKAKGTVTLINSSDAPQPLVATTRLLTPNNILFRIAKNVTVPAKGQIQVEAVADLAGKAGEIEPTTFTIPGLKSGRQKEVFAKSTNAMVATSIISSAVTTELIEKTVANLKDKLTQEAWGKVQALPKIENGSQVTPSFQKNLLEIIVAGKKTSAQIGASVASLTVHLDLKVRAVAVDSDRLHDAALHKLEEAVPQSKAVAITADSLVTTVQSSSTDPEMAVLHLQAKAQAQLKNDDALFAKEHLLGLSREAVKKYFEEIPGVAKVDVTTSPFWVNNFPSTASRVKVFFLNAI